MVGLTRRGGPSGSPMLMTVLCSLASDVPVTVSILYCKNPNAFLAAGRAWESRAAVTSRDGADSLKRLPRRWLLAGDEVHDVEALEQALDQELYDASLGERSKRPDVAGRAFGMAIDFVDILRIR